jgi:molybdenum cofactor cytidylyltransferase
MGDIGALILAAGGSRRLGRPKQLLKFRGRSLVRRAADAAIEAGCAPAAVVIGGSGEETAAEFEGSGAALIVNEQWESGLGSSIQAGARWFSRNAPFIEAILLLACDQPLVDARALRGIIELRRASGKLIVASAYSGTVGIPALFDKCYLPELESLEGDRGAKSLILLQPDRVATFSCPEGAVDIDTAEDYEKLRSSGIAGEAADG